MKLLRELENFAKQLDVRIAEVMASQSNVIGSQELDEFAVKLNCGDRW